MYIIQADEWLWMVTGHPIVYTVLVTRVDRQNVIFYSPPKNSDDIMLTLYIFFYVCCKNDICDYVVCLSHNTFRCDLEKFVIKITFISSINFVQFVFHK